MLIGRNQHNEEKQEAREERRNTVVGSTRLPPMSELW